MLIIGEKKEASTGTVSVREHGQGDLGGMTAEAFARLVNERARPSCRGFERRRTGPERNRKQRI